MENNFELHVKLFYVCYITLTYVINYSRDSLIPIFQLLNLI